MGTPPFAVPTLRALTTEHEVVAVYTRPDAVRGRGSALVPSAVKQEALAQALDVREPVGLCEDDVLQRLEELEADAIVVAAYGVILPVRALQAARFGALNVHASLLPRWRGAAPVARAILAGDEVTGVAIMRMEEGLDTGPWAMSVQVAVEGLYLDELTSQLAEAGADALVAVLRLVEAGTATWHEQDEAGVTYASKMTAADVALDPGFDAQVLWRRVRASSASAPSVATVAGTRVRIVRAAPVPAESAPGAGDVIAGKRELVLGTAEGGLALERIVPEGKGEMDGAAWARGARLAEDATWSAP